MGGFQEVARTYQRSGREAAYRLDGRPGRRGLGFGPGMERTRGIGIPHRLAFADSVGFAHRFAVADSDTHSYGVAFVLRVVIACRGADSIILCQPGGV